MKRSNLAALALAIVVSCGDSSRPSKKLAERFSTVPLAAPVVCAYTQDGLTAVVRASPNREEMARALIKHGGSIVDAGKMVRYLSHMRESAYPKVRILETDRECFVVVEAITR